MSDFWKRLWRALGPVSDELPNLEDEVTAPGPPPDEAFLRGLLERIASETAEEPRRSPVGDRDFWAALDRLSQNGRSRTAMDLLGRFVAARPDDRTLVLRLAEMHCERLQHEAARPLLTRLTDSEHATMAHLLLADADERLGHDEAALAHLEAVLADDIDHPQARSRADRLRRARGVIQRSAAETVAGMPVTEQLGGRYALRRELGRGATGAVYLAHDAELDREVAIKLLHPQGRVEARAHALMEARAAAAIRHPGVVAVYDIDEDRHFIVMELCRGGSLQTRLQRGPLPVAVARARLGELVATLEAVQARGILHGDIKPANLLYRQSHEAGHDAGDELVLADFGLARIGPLTVDEVPAGTVAYMAPEAQRGQRGLASEVYSLGVTLIEALRGSEDLEPWLGDRVGLCTGRARWDGRLPPDAADLLPLCRRLIDPDPQKRPSLVELRAALSG